MSIDEKRTENISRNSQEEQRMPSRRTNRPTRRKYEEIAAQQKNAQQAGDISDATAKAERARLKAEEEQKLRAEAARREAARRKQAELQREAQLRRAEAAKKEEQLRKAAEQREEQRKKIAELRELQRRRMEESQKIARKVPKDMIVETVRFDEDEIAALSAAEEAAKQEESSSETVEVASAEVTAPEMEVQEEAAEAVASPVMEEAEAVQEEAQMPADVETEEGAVQEETAEIAEESPVTEEPEVPVAKSFREMSEEILPEETQEEPAKEEAAVQEETSASENESTEEKPKEGEVTSETKPETTEKTAALKNKKKKNFIQKHKGWFILIILAVLILAVILILALRPQTVKEDVSYMDQIRNEEVTVNDDPKLTEFFTTYYEALSSGNTTALERMFDDPTKAMITTEISTIVDSYDNLQIYKTQGIEEDSFVVFVYNDIHFANIEATAPSVDGFYLTKDEASGSYKLRADVAENEEILKYMNLVSYREPIRSLLSDTDAKLSEVLNGNKDLNNLYILMQSMTEAAAVQPDEAAVPEAESVPGEE